MIHNEITVIVAEDEPIILHNISKKVSLAHEYIRILNQVQNGQEALQAFKKQVPDILITDIEMPGINGLELIALVRQKYPQTHIIIISGYSNFEYAQTAIKYGVEDYITKPVSNKDLVLLLNELVEKILSERILISRDILSLTLQGNLPVLPMPSSFEEGHFALAYITLGNLPSHHANSHFTQEYLELWNILDFQSCFSSGSYFDFSWIIDESYPLQKFLILHTNADTIPFGSLALQLEKYISTAIHTLPFHIFLYDKLINYQSLWETARLMRNNLPQFVSLFQDSCTCYPSGQPLPAPSSITFREHIEMLYRLTEETSFIRYALTILVEYNKKQYAQSYTENLIYEIFQILPVAFDLDEPTCSNARLNFFSKLYRFHSLEEMCSVLELLLTTTIQCHSAEFNSNNLYLKLKAYIETNYKEKISVNDISDTFGYTASYINRLFKKECNLSPLQYLTSKRIEKAKELLQQNCDIKTTAASIGYEDARYFSRVFKNETGQTPTDWLKSLPPQQID